MTKKTLKAVSIEALLIWTYRDQRAADDVAGLHESEVQADGGTWQGRSGDGVAALMDRARLGCKIESGGGKATATPRLHPDAEVVDAWVRALGEETARMVIRYAQIAERPYVPPPPRIEPLRWGDDGMGEAEAVPRALLGPPPKWISEGGRAHLGEGVLGDGLMRLRKARGRSFYAVSIRWTPIIQRPSAAYVEICLARFWCWWEALTALRELLRDARFRDHSPTDEAPPPP